MEPILQASGLQQFDRADDDRVGGWRPLYNVWASARRFRKWPAGAGRSSYIPPIRRLSSSVLRASKPSAPFRCFMCRDEDPTDVRKVPGQVSDDVADMVRYGMKSYMSADMGPPASVSARETYARYPNTPEGKTNQAMAMLRLEAEQQRSQYIRRRPRFGGRR